MENIVIGLLAFVAGVFISRFIFRIDTMVTNLEEQTKYLRIQAKIIAHLAEKQGVPEDVINKCFKDPKVAQAERLKQMAEQKFGKLSEENKL